MSQTRHKGIIAYGTEKDREKLAVLSHLWGQSGSQLIVGWINEKYSEVFGDTDPTLTALHRSD